MLVQIPPGKKKLRHPARYQWRLLLLLLLHCAGHAPVHVQELIKDSFTWLSIPLCSHT